MNTGQSVPLPSLVLLSLSKHWQENKQSKAAWSGCWGGRPQISVQRQGDLWKSQSEIGMGDGHAQLLGKELGKNREIRFLEKKISPASATLVKGYLKKQNMRV